MNSSPYIFHRGFIPRQFFNAGFSLIELLITVSIISLLTGLTMVGYGTFNKKQTVKTSAYQLASDLRLAQQKAISGEKPAGSPGCTGDLLSWKVFIRSDSYYLVASCSIQSPQSSPVVYFPSNVTSSVGGIAIIEFTPLTGAVASGNGTYTLTGDYSGTTYTNTVEITPSGGINVN